MVKYVYDFSEGDKSMKDLLGGKGANLAEMTKLFLPDSQLPPKRAASTCTTAQPLKVLILK